MNLLKTSTDILTRISEPFAAKNELERRIRARTAAILFVVLLIINAFYWRQFFNLKTTCATALDSPVAIDILFNMRVSKAPTKIITQLGDTLHAETEQQRQVRAISAFIVFCLFALLYYFFT